jgi:hypothetical protein
MDGGRNTHGRESVLAKTPKPKSKIKMDSGFRRNDELGGFRLPRNEEVTGFRHPPENQNNPIDPVKAP